MSDSSITKKGGLEKFPSQKRQKEGRKGRILSRGQDGQTKIPETSVVAAANKSAIIRFNKSASTTALQTNFLEVKEVVLIDLIERFPLVGPHLRPNFLHEEDTTPSLTALQIQYKDLYLREARETCRRQTEIWKKVKASRDERGFPVSRTPESGRTLRSGTSSSSSAEPPPPPSHIYHDFDIEKDDDSDEDGVEDQSLLLFEPYEEAYQAWKVSFRQQCLDNCKTAAMQEYQTLIKAAAKQDEETKEQSIALFSAIQKLLDYQLLRMLQMHPEGKEVLAAAKKDPLALWKVVESMCLYPAATTKEQAEDCALNDYVNFPACAYNLDIYVYNERYKIVKNNYTSYVSELSNYSSLKHYTDRIKASKFDNIIKRVQADLLETKGSSYTLSRVMAMLEELDLQSGTKNQAKTPVYGAWGVKSGGQGKSEKKTKKDKVSSGNKDKDASSDSKKQKTADGDSESRVCYHCKLPGHLKSECQVLRAQTMSGKTYKCCEDLPAQQNFVCVGELADVSTREPYVPILSYPSFCGSVRRDDEMLEFIFDPGSQESITSYPHTLVNKIKGPVTGFNSVAGFTTSRVQGDLGPFGKAYLASPESKVILLSQASMRHQFGSDMHVYYDNDGNYYDVTLHGIVYRFTADDPHTIKPLYKLKLPISEIHINTVHKNEEGLSRREREKNRRCIRLISDAGYNNVKEMLAHGMITECEETSTEVAEALRVHGYPAGWHQGKTVTKSSKLPRIEPALPYLIKQQDLEVDLMFAAGVGFLISVSRPLGMTVVNHLAGKGAPMLMKALKAVLKLYEQRGFQVRRISVDGESGITHLDEWLAAHNIQLDPRAPGEHVKLVERKIRLIKERVRCHLSALPFKLAYSLLKWLVMYCVYNINMIPYHDGAGYWVTPREMFTGRKCNRKRDLYSFGEYVQVKTVDGVDSNSVELPRTEGGIVLLPTGSMDGGVMILLLRSMRVVRRTQMQRLPMPDTVIQYLTAFALSQKKQIPQQPSYIVGTRVLDEIDEFDDIYDDESVGEAVDEVEYVDTVPQQQVEEWIEEILEYEEEFLMLITPTTFK